MTILSAGIIDLDSKSAILAEEYRDKKRDMVQVCATFVLQYYIARDEKLVSNTGSGP